MSRKNASNSEQVIAEKESNYLTDRRAERIHKTVINRQRGLMVIMETVWNPHNLAAIARSCDAFGVQQIAYTAETAEDFDPQEIGRITSSSASKWLDYRVFEGGTVAALTTLKAEGWHIAATSSERVGTSIYEMDFTQYQRFAVMVGNEHTGISEQGFKLADSLITIPMLGMIRSFNVSVATAIILAEITRQRRASTTDFCVSSEEAERLRQDFMFRR